MERLIHHHTTTPSPRVAPLARRRENHGCVGNLGLVAPSGAGHALVLGPAGWFQNAANFEPIVDAIEQHHSLPADLSSNLEDANCGRCRCSKQQHGFGVQDVAPQPHGAQDDTLLGAGGQLGLRRGGEWTLSLTPSPP